MAQKPFGTQDRLLESIQLLEKQVQDQQWTQAKARVKYAMQAWDRIVNRIQYSVERESIYDILGALARIQGGIAAKDDQRLWRKFIIFMRYGITSGTNHALSRDLLIALEYGCRLAQNH